jgi:hypothetical protein
LHRIVLRNFGRKLRKTLSVDPFMSTRIVTGSWGVLALVMVGCGGRAVEDESGKEPSTEPPVAVPESGGVEGSMSLGDGVPVTQLSGVAYYEDFFVEGIAVTIVPWAGAECGVAGGFTPDFEWLKLAGHDGKRLVMLSLSGSDAGTVNFWEVNDDAQGLGMSGLGKVHGKFEGIQLPKKPGDTVSGQVTFADPTRGIDGALSFSVEYCGSG